MLEPNHLFFTSSVSRIPLVREPEEPWNNRYIIPLDNHFKFPFSTQALVQHLGLSVSYMFINELHLYDSLRVLSFRFMILCEQFIHLYKCFPFVLTPLDSCRMTMVDFIINSSCAHSHIFFNLASS